MIDKDTLLKSVLPERTVELPGRGEVRVRSLTRAEALRLNAADEITAEVIALSCGLVDPALSDVEALELIEATGAVELQPVVTAILELSGLIEGAQKRSRTRTNDRRT